MYEQKVKKKIRKKKSMVKNTSVKQKQTLLTHSLLTCLLLFSHSPPISACLVSPKIPKKCYSAYHIECLRPVHGVLNVDEKKLIAQFGGKLRDERFEPN